MRAVFLDAPRTLSLVEREVPTPGPGELLIRVRAATTCGTDLKAWRRGHPKIPMPGPFGHEWSGEVAAAGEGAAFAPGDAVMGVHSRPCGACRWCRVGQGNLCETILATMVLGSYAEYLLIPARIAGGHVFAKPPSLPFAQASLLEPLSSVAQGLLEIRRVGPPVGTALVIGPGAIGLMFAALLRRDGWVVTLAGRRAARLAVGEAMGVRTVPLSEAPGDFDLVVECTGMVEVWERSVDYVRRGGLVQLFGGPPGGTRASFDTHRLHYDQITLSSPFHFGTPAVTLAYEALVGGLDLSPLISGERGLAETPAVFDDLDAGRGIKWAIVP